MNHLQNKKQKRTFQKVRKTKKEQKKPIETVDLEVPPATMIQIGDKPIGERLGKKEPNVFIKAPAYYNEQS